MSALSTVSEPSSDPCHHLSHSPLVSPDRTTIYVNTALQRVVTRTRAALAAAAPARPVVPPRYRPAALFVLLAALFGGAFTAIETGLRELPPVLFAGLRFDLAAAALLGYVAVRYPREAWTPRTRGDLAGVAVAAAFLVVANNALLFVGQGSTTPAVASVMYGLNPVLAPVLAWWLLGDRLSRTGVLGVGVALAGVVLVVRPSPAALADAGTVGQLLVLAAAAAVAVGSVLLQRVEPRLDSVPLTAWAMAVGAVGLHAVSLAVGESPGAVLDVGPATVASVLVVGLPSTAVAYAVYFHLIDRVGSVRANLVAYAVPVFAALTGWLVTGAAVSRWTVVGFLVVAAGFGLLERETLRETVARVRGGSTTRPTDCRPGGTPPCDD
jgi:drug/metabolite transporter (DMT)-like permease